MNSKKTVNKIDKIVKIYPEKCPDCNYHLLKRVIDSKRTIVDLKFMKNGLKKWVIRFEGGIFVCDKCHKAFVSENFKNIRRYKYGKNLIKWSINQHICYRISFKKITDILLDSFNIKVSTTAMYEFKSKLAKEYQEVYQEIIKNIINGNLIHADETQAKIKGLSGYVWVFTNMDSVYYLFRPTREADFLKDLLNEFNGVLISDFYTGYDALPCPQ